MSYCLNLECPAPNQQKTPNPLEAKFCSNCGAKLLLNDRYRALEAIGQGGFGRTFLAVDELKPSKPACVIKQFFRQEPIEPPEKAAELFRLEAVRLEELGQNSQIPTLLAYFEQDQQKYLVQEFINGWNLEQELRETGGFDEAQVRQLLADLLPVLQYIHRHQVIHRDIKPENIIRRSSDRRFVLVDFGASKLVSETPSELGTKIGSPGYIAPEQAEGNATFASDLYSLGATCVHLLTELPPSEVLNPQRPNTWKLHLKQPLTKLFEAMLEQMLQVDLRQRYSSVEAILQDLERVPLWDDLSRSPLWDINSVGTLPTSPRTPKPAPTAAPSVHPSSGWECVHSFTAHESWIRTIAFSPDGTILVSGSGDKTIKLWSVETAELRQTLHEHSSWVRAIALSPDGATLATAANDKTVYLWDFKTGQLQTRLTGHTDWVRGVAFTADGKTLITASQDKTAVVWDWELGLPIQTLAGHSHWVVAIAISPDGQTVATASRDGTVKLWQWQTGTCRYTLTGHSAEVLAVAVSPDNNMVVSSSADHTVQLWALRTGKHLHTITDHTNAVNCIAFSPDGKVLATGSNDQTIRLWKANSGKAIATLTGHNGWIWSIAFSPDGQTLASSSWDGVIKIWRRRQKTPLQ
ncbi:protein kinase [Oscillatoria sp. FACHB-1407]|uniref:serine/threonine-protein kinase n=1 Tax=Oscillatoria sp. FACHB-1407 TaxID=2692847 RepID=UPI001682B282|nr:serine/threonine-protein kinase [Oscillatoria sp. FACHB-1407]MBD2464069.1 protein kinase [Oscillatoria sp. FACHB-1407]